MSQKMKFSSPRSLDENIATSLYSHFGMVVPQHTSNEIGKFESFHRHIIQARISASKNNIGNEQGLGEQEKAVGDEIKHYPDYDTL